MWLGFSEATEGELEANRSSSSKNARPMAAKAKAEPKTSPAEISTAASKGKLKKNKPPATPPLATPPRLDAPVKRMNGKTSLTPETDELES